MAQNEDFSSFISAMITILSGGSPTQVAWR